MGRRLRFLTVIAVAPCAAAAFAIACSSEPSGSPATPTVEAGGADARLDGGSGGDSSTTDSGIDAGSTCEITRAYVVACGGDLTCGATKFDAWCAQNDTVINSETYRRAQAMCLTKANCDPDLRKDCEYKTYASATPTTAQKAVVAGYCQTCEPADPLGCATRKTTYVPSAGTGSVDDVFVAGWELADPIADEIRTKCTGAALDAGTADGGCLKAFAGCAGDIYVDRLPDCPP